MFRYRIEEWGYDGEIITYILSYSTWSSRLLEKIKIPEDMFINSVGYQEVYLEIRNMLYVPENLLKLKKELERVGGECQAYFPKIVEKDSYFGVFWYIPEIENHMLMCDSYLKAKQAGKIRILEGSYLPFEWRSEEDLKKFFEEEERCAYPPVHLDSSIRFRVKRNNDLFNLRLKIKKNLSKP